MSAGVSRLPDRIADPDGLLLRRWKTADADALGLTEAAFGVPGITHVEIHHDKANVASAGVPRKLSYLWLGEGPNEPEAPGELGIEWQWRIDRARWQARPSAA